MCPTTVCIPWLLIITFFITSKSCHSLLHHSNSGWKCYNSLLVCFLSSKFAQLLAFDVADHVVGSLWDVGRLTTSTSLLVYTHFLCFLHLHLETSAHHLYRLPKLHSDCSFFAKNLPHFLQAFCWCFSLFVFLVYLLLCLTIKLCTLFKSPLKYKFPKCSPYFYSCYNNYLISMF